MGSDRQDVVGAVWRGRSDERRMCQCRWRSQQIDRLRPFLFWGMWAQGKADEVGSFPPGKRIHTAQISAEGVSRDENERIYANRAAGCDRRDSDARCDGRAGSGSHGPVGQGGGVPGQHAQPGPGDPHV